MSFASDMLERARALIFRRSAEAELAEELKFHVEMEQQHRERDGADPLVARRESRIALGGVEQVKEDVRDARGTRWLEDFVGDVSYTLRTLGRSPGFAAVVILTLAIGIGGTTAVFSAVDAVLLQPLPYQEPGQLARLYGTWINNPQGHGFLSPVQLVEYRTRLASTQSVAAILTYNESGADVGTGDQAHRIRILPTSANYFDVMRVQPIIGHTYGPDDEKGSGAEDNIQAAPVVVISQQLWKTQYNSDNAIVGKSIAMDGRSFTVAGVMPAGYRDPIAGAVDAYVPIDLTSGSNPQEAGNHYLTAITRLRPGIGLARAEAEVDRVALQLAAQFPQIKDERGHLYSLKEDIVGSSSRSLMLMLGAVALVLLLVCVNIANLMLVRSSERGREFAVRSALGAVQGRLIRQMLVESLTLAVGGAVAGIVVARLAMSAIVALGSGSIPRLVSLSLDLRLLAFSFVVATTCSVLFGLLPALRASRAQPGDALRDQSRGATSGGRALRLREWLVISQVAVAFILLVGAGLLLMSFKKVQQLDLGINPDRVLTFELNLPDARYDSTARGQFYDRLAAQIGAIPGVRAAGAISKLPSTGAYHQWSVRTLTGPLAGDEKLRSAGAENRVITADYFRAVGIPLIAGRIFDARDDEHAPDRVVISKSLAEQLYPKTNAVGQTLRTGGRTSEVIGVVGDVAVTNEGMKDHYVYHAHRQFAGDRNWPLTQVIASSGPISTIEPAVRRVVTTADPQLVMFRPAPLDEVIGHGAAQRAFTLKILATFALVALALSALGLFGVLSYGVKLRSREFGIRMALGAERGAIGGMVLRQGLTVASIGVVIGLAGAAALAKIMTSILFNVSPLDVRVLAGAVLFMAVIAGIAAYLPAHRATGVDPREILG